MPPELGTTGKNLPLNPSSLAYSISRLH